MQELWVIHHDHWALPIFVEWPDQEDVAEVFSSYRKLLDCQRIALEQLLDKIGTFRDGVWWIMRGDLTKHAVKVEHNDPELCVEWKPTQSRRCAVRETPDQDEFVAEFC